MKVWEIAKEAKVEVLPGTLITTVRKLFRDTEERVIPIISDEREKKLLGFLTRVEAIIPTSAKSNLRAIDVARDHPVIRVDEDVDDVYRKFKEFKVYEAPVVDENGRVVGVVSYRDLIEAFVKHGVRPLAETVAEVMTTEDIESMIVTPDERVNRVWSKLVYRGHKAVIVVRSLEERYPIGIVTPLDLIRRGRWRFHREIRAGRIIAPAKVKRIMTRGVIVATPDTRIEDVARVMVENDFSVIPVVDDEGRVIGIVTQEDVVRTYIEGAKPGRVPVKPIPLPKPVTVEERIPYRSTQAILQEVAVKPEVEVYRPLKVTVGSIVRHEMPAISINDTVEHARREMLRRKTNYLLVTDEAGRIIGVVSKWSMLKAIALRGPLWRRRVYDKFFIDFVMERSIPRVKVDDQLEDVAFAMVSNNSEVAIVEDNEGRIIGFVTKDDLIEAYARNQVGRLLVENVMVPGRMTIVHPHHSLAHVVNKMKTLMLDALVVYDGTRILGVVSSNRLPFVAYEDALTARKSRRLIWVRKLVRGGARKARFVKVAPLVAADVTTEVSTLLTPKDDIFKVIEALRKENVDGLPVVDDSGKPIGIISKNTILREMARHARVALERARPVTPSETKS